MPDRFRACPSCGYAVRADAPHCPDCGRVSGPPPSALGRLLGRGKPRFHPENLRALEARLREEVERLVRQTEHLEATRATLRERTQAARDGGRDPGPLVEALRGLDQALEEARDLQRRQQAVLAGVGVERDHNALRALVSGMEGDAGSDALALLEAGPTRRELCRLPADRAPQQLAWAPDGRLLAGLAGFGARLLLWDLAAAPPALRELEVPGGDARALAFGAGAPLVAIGIPGGVRLLDPQRGAWTAGLAFPGQRLGRGAAVTALASGPGGAWLAVGTERGEIALLDLSGTGAEPRFGRPVQAVPGFPVRGLAVGPDGLKLWSSGGPGLRIWWVRQRQLVPFSERMAEGVGLLAVHRSGGRIAAEQAGMTAVYDAGLSQQLGRVPALAGVSALAFAPDGERLLLLDGDALVLGSPDARRARALIPTGGVLSAAFPPDGMTAICASKVADGVVLERLDLGEGGLCGRTFAAAAALERALDQAARLRAEHGLDQLAGLASERNLALRSQLEAMVRDAGLAVVYAVTRRAQLAEGLTRAGGPFEAAGRVLADLFAELLDLHGQLVRALPLGPDLAPTIGKLELLPVSALRGQVDSLLQVAEATLRAAHAAPEEAQREALDRLRAQQAHLERLARLANDLAGPFWGNPERPPLLAALGRLQRDFPGLVDAMLARIASSAIGRIDGVEESFGVDRLRDQRARIAGQGPGGDVAAEADWLLENALGNGPLGKEQTEAERRGARESLDEAWRRLDAETRAFLETQRAGRGE